MEGGSVTVVLLDAQRWGELDTAERRPSPPNSELLKLADETPTYHLPPEDAGAAPLSSLLPEGGGEAELQESSNRVLRQALGLL